MKKTAKGPYIINTISELYQLWSMPGPEHPLVSVVDLKDIRTSLSNIDDAINRIVFNFYSVWLEKDVKEKIRYGQNYFDFDEGAMIFISPGQVLSVVQHESINTGIGLVIHPDFLKGYPLSKKIREYGYFSYAITEALHLSEKEEATIVSTLHSIAQEYRSPIDAFSHDVIISHIEVLLNYCNRFYHRQFITRKTVNLDLLTRMDAMLSDYFNSGKITELGLPSVQYLSRQLNVSPNYLGDLLKAQTSQNAQQHIHNKIIERAKELISTTSKSISEIAFELGFEHSQSFSKLFKNKTNISPGEYRKSFN